MYNENSVPADPLDASYVAIVTEWLGGGLPSTDHHVTLSVHGVWSREASDRGSNKFEVKSDVIWRNPIERRTYLLTQLDDLSNNNNNNNKISAPSSYEWTDGYKGLFQKDETEDDQNDKKVVGNSAGGAVGARVILIDDVTSGDSHDVIEDGFVLIDGFSCPKEIAVSGKYLPGSEEIRREEISLNSLFVNERTKNQSDDSRFESETELERKHFWKSEADVKKPSSKSESFSVSLSKEPHLKDVAVHSMVTSPSITNYESDMKHFFQNNDPSTDHFHLFTVSGEMENESGKSTGTKQVSSYRFPLKPNIQKKLLIQVNNPDWEFPVLYTHKRDDSKHSSILSRDNSLPEEISTTGIHSANKTPDDSITTTASAFTSTHSIHIPGNVQIKPKPGPTVFESMVAEELTNIFVSGKREVEKELEIPDFEFSETESKKETKKGNEGLTSEKESETSQMEKIQNVFLPDFDFDDTGTLGSKTEPYEKEHSTTMGKTKAKVETPTKPAKNITTSVKGHSKVGVGDQGNIDLPSFGFMNLSGEVPAVSSVLTSTSTLTTTHKSENTDFENLVSQELTNIIDGKQDMGLHLHGQDYNKRQTSEVTGKVKREIQGGKTGKEGDTAQMEIIKNIALPDFDFDEDLKPNIIEEHFQSKPVTFKSTGEVKTKVESAENPSMTNTTTRITQMKTKEGKDEEKIKKKIQENIELPSFGFEDLSASSASSSISAFEKMLTQELTSVIESGKKEAAKQMEIPDFTFDFQDFQQSNVNQKVTKDYASERINEATEIEKVAEINLPDFEFDETTTAAATTATTINNGKNRHVTSEAQTIKATKSAEKEKLTKEGKLENLQQTTQGHVIIPSFDFENLSSRREAASSFSSSMTFSSAKSTAREGDDSLEFHKDEVLEEHAELVGKEFKSPLVTTQVSLKSVDGKFPKRSEFPQRGTDDNSAVSTQITTSVITIAKTPQSPEKTHPKTSIKLISRAESYDKSKEAAREAKEKHQDFQNISFDKPDYQGSPKQAEHGKRSVDDSNKFQLPTFGFDSHLPGQDKMYSIVADEKIVIERDSKTSAKPTKVSESTPETGNFTMIPFFKLKSKEGDEELESEITNTETPSVIPRETATEKNIKMEFPTFGFGSISRKDTFDGGANETKEDETTEIPDNDDKNETMLMQTGTEAKFGSKALPDESILNAGTIESYVNKIMESAVNSIKHMDLIEKPGKKSHVDDEDDDEGEEDIEVPYSELKDEDEDDEEEEKMKLFKKTIDTDGLGNIIVHREGGEGTKRRVDDDYDFDQKSENVHLPGGDDDGQDVTHSFSERLRNLTRDLVVEKPPLSSTSSVEIVITPATPVDRSVAISYDWYGKLNETLLIEEEKMEEKRARQMADEMQKSSDDFAGDSEAEDGDDDDDYESRKNVLTYDDDDMKIYDVYNDDNDDDDDHDDDDDDDSNTDDDLSGPFSKYKREVIRISFDDDESGDDGRKASTSSNEDRINLGIYSPKKRFSLENIETIKEENETAHMEDPFSPSYHETVTPGIFGATVEKDASGLISVSQPRFQVGDVDLENVVSKVAESAGPVSITTSTDVAVTTPTSEATVATSSRDGTDETSLSTFDTSLHSFNLTDQKPVTPLEQNVIVPATITAATDAFAATEATSTTSSGQQNDLDVLIPVAGNVRPSEKIHTSTDHSGMNVNLPHVGLHSTSSTKTSEKSDVSVATTTAPTSSATVIDEALFSTAVSSDNVVVAQDVTTTSTSSTADVKEIGGRIVVGSLLSTFDIEVIPDSSVPPPSEALTKKENWSGNTETTESETKLEQKDFGTFDDDLDVEDKNKITFFDIERGTTFLTSDSNSLDVNQENQESEKNVGIEIPFFDIRRDLTNTLSDLPIAEVKGQRKDVTSFPSYVDASSGTTAEVHIPRASGSTNVDDTLITTSASSAEEAVEIGERLLLGSLLSTVDVNVIPASPVPPSVMEDENWFGNTEVSEKEATAFKDDTILHDVDTNITGDINMEIPFFDIGQDFSSASSDLLISKREGQGRDVTSFPLDKSPPEAMNLNLTTAPASSDADAKEIGVRVLAGSLLSSADVEVVPASPVPPSVMEDENWFGNTNVNEKETNLEQQEFGALDDDIEIEEKIQVPFFDIESNDNIVESKTGFGRIEIPFFDIKGDLSNDLSLSEVEVKDKAKLVTSSSVQTTLSSAKALDISTQFFNISASTAPFPSTLTTSSIEGISLPTVSPLISEDQKASRTSSEYDTQEHSDETLHDKGITDAAEKEDKISVTDQDDILFRSGALKRKRPNVKGEPADGEEDDDEEFMIKRSSSSTVRSFNTRIIDAPREYNDSYVAESDEDDIREDIKDFDIGKITIGHSIEAPAFSQEKQFEILDLTQEGDGKAKFQEISTFDFDFKPKVITSGEEFHKSHTNESETYDENIRRLDSLLERSRRELDVLKPGADKNETADEDGKPHHASKEEEHFLLDTTLDQSLAEFRDVSSVMSPGSDVTEDSPTIGWRSTGKVHQVPLDNLLDNSALESPAGSGEVKVGRRTLGENWLDTSTETSESVDKFELLPDQVPIRDEEKLTHLSGPIRKKDNVPADSRMTYGSSMHKSITLSSSSSSSTVTFTKPSSRDDDDDDLRLSSEIDWSIKAWQSDENKVGHDYETSNQASSPSSIQKVTTTTRVMSDSLSSDLVLGSNDLTQKSGQQDSQQENISTDIREVVDKDQEIEDVDFKALHEKSLKDIQSGVESNQPSNQENEALDSKEISESAKEITSTAPELEPQTTNADDGGIRTDSSAAKSALDGLLSDAERMQVQVEMSNYNTEPSLIIYAPGGDVAKVQDNIKGMAYAASNANDGVQLEHGLLENVEVSSDKSSNIKIEVRDLDKSQEKDPESTEGKILYIAPSGTLTPLATKYQSPIEPMIAEEAVDVVKPKSEKESDEVVNEDGSGLKTETSTAKSALDGLLSDAERMQVQVEMSNYNTEPSLIIYAPGGDVAKVQDNIKGMAYAASNANDGVQLEHGLLENVEVSSDKSSNIKIEVRDLDKSQEKDPESTEGKILYIAPSGTLTPLATKYQSPIEPMIAEEAVDVVKPKSEKESDEVVNEDGSGLKTETSTAKSALDGLLSDAERMQVQVEMSNYNTEPSLIIYAPGGDVAKVQDNIKGMAYAASNANDGVQLEHGLLENVEVSSDKSSNIKIEVRDLDKPQEKDPESSTEGKIIYIAPSGTVTLRATKDHSPIDEEAIDVAKPKSEKEGGDRGRIKTETSTAKSDAESSLTHYTPRGDAVKDEPYLGLGQARGLTQVDVADTEQVSPENEIVDSSDKPSDKKIEVRDLDKSQEKDQDLSAEGHISLVSPPAKVILQTAKDHSPIESMIAGGNLNVNRAKPRSGAGIEDIISDDGGRQAETSTGSIPVYSMREESEDASNWKEVIIADSKHLVDMKAVEPYKKCVAHGGYYGNGLNAIIVLSACHLPPKNIPNYTYVMDNLFYYIMNVLDVMAVDQYKLVYLHGTMTEAKLPPNKWMKKCYETIDRKLKKKMEQMLVVHPTFWLKTLIFLFASSKFSKKLVYIKSLADLKKLFSSEDLQIPEEVVEVDHKLNPPKKRSK